MTRQRSPEDAKYWLNEADERLDHARGYSAGSSARIYCEQAHYAAEFAIKALIISKGGTFATSHNINALLETAARLGEAIPTEVESAKGLSSYAGAGRYDFDRDPETHSISEAAYERALNAADKTLTWARRRVNEILDIDEQRKKTTHRSRSPRPEPGAAAQPPEPANAPSQATGTSEAKTRERVGKPPNPYTRY